MTERKFLTGPPTTKPITGHSSSPRSLIHVRPTTVRPEIFSVQCASDERLAHGAAVLLDLELNFGEREKVLGIICLLFFLEKTRVRSVKNINFFVSVGAPQHDKTLIDVDAPHVRFLQNQSFE